MKELILRKAEVSVERGGLEGGQSPQEVTPEGSLHAHTCLGKRSRGHLRGQEIHPSSPHILTGVPRTGAPKAVGGLLAFSAT